MKRRSGFTIIEVTLFLAISAFLIIGLIVGTGATVSRQRYNDSVQDFAEFLRRQYSEVINVENGRTDKELCKNENTGEFSDPDYHGRTGCLVYGRLLIFGRDPGKVEYYTVVGKDLGSEAAKHPDTLTALTATSPFLSPTTQSGEYLLQWGAKAERAADSQSIRASILIVRAPENGSIYTYVYDGIIDPEDHTEISKPIMQLDYSNRITPEFKTDTLNFCVGSEDIFAVGGRRRNIRLHENGRNATAVELIAQDDEREEEGNQCQE